MLRIPVSSVNCHGTMTLVIKNPVPLSLIWCTCVVPLFLRCCVIRHMVLIALKHGKVLRLPLRSNCLYNRLSQLRFDRFSRGLYNIVDPSVCDVRTLCCSLVNNMLLSLAAFRAAFEGRMGWSLRMSSSFICSSGVMGCSGVTGTVSPRGISSISGSPSVEPFDETFTTLGSG